MFCTPLDEGHHVSMFSEFRCAEQENGGWERGERIASLLPLANLPESSDRFKRLYFLYIPIFNFLIGLFFYVHKDKIFYYNFNPIRKSAVNHAKKIIIIILL